MNQVHLMEKHRLSPDLKSRDAEDDDHKTVDKNHSSIYSEMEH